MLNARKRIVHTAVLILSILMIAGCGNLGSSGPKAVTSADGRIQVVVPKGWKSQRTLHNNADIQVADLLKEGYLIVLSDSKMDLDNMTFKEHSKLTRETILENLKNGRVSSGPAELEINGRPAVQYEIRGSVDEIKVIYFHTTVDGKEAFHQILAWTLPSKFKQNQGVLKTVINSFKEIDAGAEGEKT